MPRAAFACWPAADAALPMYGQGYNDTNVCGPVYNQLMEYDNWDKKQLLPALAEHVEESAGRQDLDDRAAQRGEVA